MSKIDELIKELCPNGVEWKKLGEVCNFQNGFAFKSKYFRDNGHAIIRITNIDNNIIDLNDVIYFDKTDYKEDLRPFEVYNGDIMVAMSGATTGKIGIYRGFDICYINQRVGAFRPKENLHNGYLYHYLTSKVNEMYILAGGGAQPNLSSTKLMSTLEIPLPPLAIQEEIVRILDKFVEQQEQLEKLIELRKKQYEYYREELLRPKEGEEWERKTLGEIGTFVRGNGLQKTDFTEEGCPCIHYGQVHTYYGFSTTITKSFCREELYVKLKKASYGDLIIATTSEDVDACCKATVWLGEGEVGISGDSYLFSHNQDPIFIAHLFRTKSFSDQKRMVATGAKVVRVSGDSMAKFVFQIPSSLIRQQEIADALDKFESSIASLTSALDASKARYAHYRDQLLNFELLSSNQIVS